MFNHRTYFILSLCLLLLLSMAAIAQAAPPRQEGGATGGASFGETLDLDDVDDTGHNNLGTIMSGRKDVDNVDDGADDSPDDMDGGVDDVDDDVDNEPDDGNDDTDGNTDDDADGGKQHPVAAAIANYFGVSYDEIMTLHEAGNGFGNITKAYFFADKIGMEPGALLDLAHGSGWGNVLKENGIHPGSVGNGGAKGPGNANHHGTDGPPGQAKKAGGSDLESTTNTSELVGQGNNGNGKGNNGNNGNGHKGGNGNGGGNGNNHKGGNGNGGGKGHNGK